MNGLSECCKAQTTFVESALVCKKCYQEQSLEVLMEAN